MDATLLRTNHKQVLAAGVEIEAAPASKACHRRRTHNIKVQGYRCVQVAHWEVGKEKRGVGVAGMMDGLVLHAPVRDDSSSGTSLDPEVSFSVITGSILSSFLDKDQDATRPSLDTEKKDMSDATSSACHRT